MLWFIIWVEVMNCKGIILAGGTGSRLKPLTEVVNKHLLPVDKIPMIYHGILLLRDAGIDEIMVITGTEHAGQVFQSLGSGSKFDVNITYRVQDNPGGIAQALMLAENFVGNDKFMLLLGDNLYGESLRTELSIFMHDQDNEARVLLKDVGIENVKRYGMAIVEDDKIIDIIEKPRTPVSSYAVTGCYFYPPSVFKDVLPYLKPSARGELEITDVSNYYVKRNKMGYCIIDTWWTDAGSLDSYAVAQDNACYYRNKLPHLHDWRE